MLNEMSPLELPEDVIYAMARREWRQVCWNAAVNGILQNPSRVVSTKNGVWYVACASTADMAMLAKNQEIKARLTQYHARRPLDLLSRIQPVPEHATSSQARMHAGLRQVYRQTPLNSPDPLTASTLLRQVRIDAMPAEMWHKLALRMAVGPEYASRVALLRVDHGIWSVQCGDAQTARFVSQTPSVLATLQWLSRYRKITVKRIECLQAVPSNPDFVSR